MIKNINWFGVTGTSEVLPPPPRWSLPLLPNKNPIAQLDWIQLLLLSLGVSSNSLLPSCPWTQPRPGLFPRAVCPVTAEVPIGQELRHGGTGSTENSATRNFLFSRI